MNKHQITLGSTVASLALLILMHPASAATFKWANDGDVRAMDPYTSNETVQNSFLNNIYERLVQRDKQLGIEPALAVSWKQTSATVWRFNLHPTPRVLRRRCHLLLSAHQREELGQALASEHDQGGAQDR